MSLDGPSRTIVVEPLRAPEREPAPRERPAADPPAPREPGPAEPAHEPREPAPA